MIPFRLSKIPPTRHRAVAPDQNRAARRRIRNVTSLTRKGVTALAVITASLVICGCAGMGKVAPRSQTLARSALDAGAAIRAADADARWPAAEWWRAYNDP